MFDYRAPYEIQLQVSVDFNKSRLMLRCSFKIANMSTSLLKYFACHESYCIHICCGIIQMVVHGEFG